MEKIKMSTPLVEMDGDEMTRILWKIIKDELLTPFIDLKTEYYDLGLEHRNETNDKVTFESAEATKKYEVGYIWACKNYDGDVMSDMISSAFCSLAMMTSVLVSPDGYYEYEAAHGTVRVITIITSKERKLQQILLQQFLRGQVHCVSVVNLMQIPNVFILMTVLKKPV